MSVKIKLALTLALALVLMGCNSTLVIHNATTSQITPVFKDYINLHGYQLTYQNDQVGSYRIDLGSIFIPATSVTVINNETATRDDAGRPNHAGTNGVYQGNAGRPNQPVNHGSSQGNAERHNSHVLTSYERTTMQTISNPAHYVEGIEMVRILQSGSDVLILLDDNSNNIGASFSDLHDYLQELGYAIDYQ
jgi:hypothetical protein